MRPTSSCRCLRRTPCLSLGPYSPARVASNAATAYLALCHTSQVLDHANRALGVVDASPSVWSQALVRLDTATALIQAPHPDLEQTTALVSQAMARCGDNQIKSITQRTRTFVREVTPWARHPSVQDLIGQIQTWLTEASSAHD